MMEAEPAHRIDQFPDITVENKDLVPLIMAAAREAETAVLYAKRDGFTAENVSKSPAVEETVARVNMMMAQSAARCRIDPPPPADIEMLTDERGRLYYRCKHKQSHAWHLDGSKR